MGLLLFLIELKSKNFKNFSVLISNAVSVDIIYISQSSLSSSITFKIVSVLELAGTGSWEPMMDLLPALCSVTAC